MQIRPEVYLIKGKASNLYLCVDEDGLALIDAGMPNEQNLVLVEIERLGYQPKQLKRILITHADIDHAGSLAVLQEASGATVYAGDLAAQSLQRGKSPKHLPSLIQWLSNAFFGYRPVDPSCIEFIQDGDELPVLGGLQALATPGHTMGHFSFFCPANGVLFAGDALHTRGNHLQRSQKRITADESKANDSAIRLLELTPAVFACGHGDPKDDHKSDELMMLFNQLRGNDPVS